MTPSKVDGLTFELAEFVASTQLSDLPTETLENAKLGILDTVACALAATRFRVGRLVIDHVREFGAGEGATVWAPGMQASAPMAAYVNGHLANALDYDLSLHLDTHVLPAGFALGEHLNVSGSAFLEAYVVATEVGARLMKALDGGRYDGHGVSHRGWWHVGLVGPIDAALVSARLLGLDASRTASAVGISSHSVGGFRRSLGTMTKSLHSGRSARDGIHSALLARDGFTGDPEILEAPMGYLAALCPDGQFDREALLGELGTRFQLASPPKVKPFPSCGPSQAQVDSILELLRTRQIDVGRIQRVRAHFHQFSLFRTEARDEIEAGFSTPYVLAATLVDGAFGLAQLADDRVFDPTIRGLMDKVEHDKLVPARSVLIELENGDIVEATTAHRRTLRTWAEIEAKFDECAEGVLPPEAASDFKVKLTRLEHLGNLGDLMQCFRDPAVVHAVDSGTPAIA